MAPSRTSLGLLPFPLVLALAFALAGCHDPSGRTTPSGDKPNLRPSAVEVVTPAADVQAAHRLDVNVGVWADVPVEGVGVVFRAIRKEAFDAHALDLEADNWVLGGTVADVPAGGATFAVELELPADVPAGDYYVVPEVDPLGTIDESDETDNWGVKAAVAVRVDQVTRPRLMIREAALDTPVHQLPGEAGVPPAPLGVSATLAVEGDPSLALPAGELTACLLDPGDATCRPLQLWDSGSASHRASLAVTGLQAGEPAGAHLDLAVGAALASHLEALTEGAADACLADAAACQSRYGMTAACVDGCLALAQEPVASRRAAVPACLLACLPLQVRITFDMPGTALYEPPNASPGRTATLDLQLLAPVPPSPVAPEVLRILPVDDPVIATGATGCAPRQLELDAEKGSCQEPVAWSVRIAPGYEEFGSEGAIVGADLAAFYTPQQCASGLRTRKVLVEASACGQTTSTLLTIAGLEPSVTVTPGEVAVDVGATGTVELKAAVKDCAGDLEWTLGAAPADAGRWTSVGGAPDLGTLLPGADATTRLYRPPRSMTYGPRAPVTLRVHALSPACYGATGAATIQVGHSTGLSFERSYVKSFDSALFGAGVDLYAGASLDRRGALAAATAKIPLKIFGYRTTALDVENHAKVDPRPAGERYFHHSIDAFGLTVSKFDCPGDDVCSQEGDLWSDSKCWPGAPDLCIGDDYDKLCKADKDCSGGLKCRKGTCTKTCKSSSDCSGKNAACLDDLTVASPQKKTFIVVVIPVTVEAQACLNYGLHGKINLLAPVADQFGVTAGPFVEVGGTASAAVGYSGILAAGVAGEVTILRDDFTGSVTAVVLYDQTPACPWAGGCIKGELREAIENELQGLSGKVYLFVDYPTLKWCRWYPCIRRAHKEVTLVCWNSVFDVANACNFCERDADCGEDSCVDGTCADGRPGLLCREQSVFVSAE
jgi:hypothetical protein